MHRYKERSIYLLEEQPPALLNSSMNTINHLKKQCPWIFLHNRKCRS